MIVPPVIEGIVAPATPQPRRFWVLYGLLALLSVGLLGRSFYLQIWQGSLFLQAAEGNRVAVNLLPAPRGIIYDSHGQQLVENIASTDLLIDPLLLPSIENETPLIEKLPSLVGITPAAVQEAVMTARQKQRSTLLLKALDHNLVLKLEEVKAELPGIRLASSLVRKYPYGAASTHAVGYTGPISSDELSEYPSYAPTDITGKTGIEKQYDSILHGTHGAAYQEVNASGHPQKELGSKAPVAGSNVTLALDQELQTYIYQLFADRAQQRQATPNAAPVSGAVVALDPRSGAVRALVSYPSYDPNIFSQPSLRGSGAELFTSPERPLFNRALDGEYPPGSTIKPFIAAAGLEEGVITSQTTVQSTGMLKIGQWEFPDWKSGGHGVTNVNKALAESVNTFFYLLAGGDETHTGLGVVRIKNYLEKFGWGTPTKIDLPSEAAGFLPSPAWKEKVKKERWYIGDTYHLGIGQGDVLATPLQVAAATSSIASNGIWYTPHMIERISPPGVSEQITAPTTRSLPLRTSTINTVKEGMRRTVTDGSGQALAALAIPLAGKTGTAQIGSGADTHAWFTSFGPYDSPELVLTVLLEKGGEGDKDAVPFAKNIWEWWEQNRSN